MEDSSERKSHENGDIGSQSNFVDPEAILKTKRTALWRMRQKWVLLYPSDFFYPVDFKSIWRHHIIWSKKDGKKIIEFVTARFSTTLVVLSLLLSAEVGTYFSPSDLATAVRNALSDGPSQADKLAYSTGLVLLVSQVFTLSAILANYTGLVLFKSLSDENAITFLRSEVGLYSAQLPGRLFIISLYLFVAWLVLFWGFNLRSGIVVLLAVLMGAVFFHVCTTFSSAGRIILATGAMGSIPILSKEEEEKRSPFELSDILLSEAEIERHLKTGVKDQYCYQADYRDIEGGDAATRYKASLTKRHPGIRLTE